jgi:hypothetical protein
MIKDEDGVVTVSLYEDTAASAEAPAVADDKEEKPASTATETQAAEETKPEEKPATADK